MITDFSFDLSHSFVVCLLCQPIMQIKMHRLTSGEE